MTISKDFLLYRVIIPKALESGWTLLSSRTSHLECLEKFFLVIFRNKFPGRQS